MFNKLILNEKYCEGDVCPGELGIHRFDLSKRTHGQKIPKGTIFGSSAPET